MLFVEISMNKNVFREYDIRGIVEKDFSNTFVFDLGRAFGTFLKTLFHLNSKYFTVFTYFIEWMGICF